MTIQQILHHPHVKQLQRVDIKYILMNLLLEKLYGQLRLLVLFHILAHHPNVLNQKFPQLALQVIGNFLRKKHTYLEHQLKQLHLLNNIKKMCIFKQLQGQLQFVVINQENYINFFKLFPFATCTLDVYDKT